MLSLSRGKKKGIIPPRKEKVTLHNSPAPYLVEATLALLSSLKDPLERILNTRRGIETSVQQ